MFWRGFKLFHQKKLIENIPTSKVRSMAVGLVELSGKAQAAKELLTSPFSMASCVYFQYRVQEQRSSGKNSYWATVASYQSPQLFYLEDETGRVLVYPQGAELHLDVDYQYRTGGFGTGDSIAFREGMKRIGISYQAFLGDKIMRCEETLIRPEDPIYVIGQAFPSAIQSENNGESLMIGKGQGSYFILSDKSEKEMLSSLAWAMYACLYGGSGLAILSLYFFINILRIIE